MSDKSDLFGGSTSVHSMTVVIEPCTPEEVAKLAPEQVVAALTSILGSPSPFRSFRDWPYLPEPFSGIAENPDYPWPAAVDPPPQAPEAAPVTVTDPSPRMSDAERMRAWVLACLDREIRDREIRDRETRALAYGDAIADAAVAMVDKFRRRPYRDSCDRSRRVADVSLSPIPTRDEKVERKYGKTMRYRLNRFIKSKRICVVEW